MKIILNRVLYLYKENLQEVLFGPLPYSSKPVSYTHLFYVKNDNNQNSFSRILLRVLRLSSRPHGVSHGTLLFDGYGFTFDRSFRVHCSIAC